MRISRASETKLRAVPAPHLEPSTQVRRRTVLVTVFLVALVLRGGVAVYTARFSDDAFITLRVARNLIEGRGFVYNVGEHVQASSSPAHTLVAAAVWWACGRCAVIVIPLLTSVADALAAVIVAALAARAGGLVAALAAGALYATLSTVVLTVTIGLETGFYTLATALAFWACTGGRFTAAAAAAAAAALLRPDGVLVLGTVLAFACIHLRRIPSGPLIVGVATVLPWEVFAWLYFGSIVPQTIVAKSLVERSAYAEWQAFIVRFFASAPVAVIALFVILGVVHVLRARRDLVPLFFWGLAYVAAFSTFGVWWPWYLPPAMLPYAVAFGIGVAAVAPALGRRWRVLVYGAVGAITLALTARTVVLAAGTRGVTQAASSQAQEIAGWIERCTPPGASIFIEPMGALGFLVDRPIHDYPGLASRRITDALRGLHRRVPGKPIDPQAVTAALRAAEPGILVLRADEYAATLPSVAMLGYAVAREFPTTAGAARAADLQTMYLLTRHATPPLGCQKTQERGENGIDRPVHPGRMIRS